MALKKTLSVITTNLQDRLSINKKKQKALKIYCYFNGISVF